MVSFAQLIADRHIDIRPVLTARPDMAVRWVAASELSDPTPFFEGGEILLTTGLQTVGWTTQWYDYAGALRDAGTVAVGFGSGLTYACPPTDLVEACRRRELNLFEVPRRTPFVAVSHRVARLITEEENESARLALDAQRRLTAAAVKPNGVEAVLRSLSQSVDGAAAVVGADGTVQVGPFGSRRTELDIVRLAPELRRLRQGRGRSASALSTATATVVIQTLGVGGPRSRFLVALTPGPLSHGRRSAMIAAAALLGLIGEQHRSAAELRRRLRSRAVELLIAGDQKTAAVILDTDTRSRALPALVRMVRATGSAEERADARSWWEEVDAVTAESGSQLWLVAADGLAAVFARQLAESGLRVGIGRASGLDAVGESHRTAGIALTQATASAPVIDWDDLVGKGPLALIDPGVAADFSASFLDGLDSRQRHMLRCFLRHHGSYVKVAEELGVHRNTVRNRLDAIAARLAGSLDDPKLRVSAWIALQAEPTN